MMLRNYRAARDAYASELVPMSQLSGLAMAEQKLGNQAEAQHAMSRLISEVGDSALYQQAEVLAQWGDADRAFATLARAKEVGDSGLLYMESDPLLDPIRADPRFASFLKTLTKT